MNSKEREIKTLLNNLMVGDYVRTNKNVEDEYYFGKYHQGEYIKVKEILDNGINPDWQGAEICMVLEQNAIEPIELTPEILEMNGFVKYGSEYSNLQQWILKEPFGFTLYQDVFRGIWCVSNIWIKYVHEFQHILKLCKVGKEVEL